MTSYILYKLKKKPQTKEEILKAAAQLIKADIRELQQSKNIYQSVNDVNDDGITSHWIPENLNTFQRLIPSQLKRKSIRQCITQASRPRSIVSPIPFRLGVEAESKFVLKWLINHLYQLGLSVSIGLLYQMRWSVTRNQ